MNKSRGGRPKLSAEDVRTRTIGVRVSLAELAAITAIANSVSQSPSQLLRDGVLLKKVNMSCVPAINLDKYSELANLANNVNQIAKALNSGQNINHEFIINTLCSVSEKINELRSIMMGKNDVC